MVTELGIYRSANLLIDQHGEEAPIFAAMQVDELFAAGAHGGQAYFEGDGKGSREGLVGGSQ